MAQLRLMRCVHNGWRTTFMVILSALLCSDVESIAIACARIASMIVESLRLSTVWITFNATQMESLKVVIRGVLGLACPGEAVAAATSPRLAEKEDIGGGRSSRMTESSRLLRGEELPTSAVEPLLETNWAREECSEAVANFVS